MPSEVEDLRDDAERFRRLASVMTDSRNKQQLIEMAANLDRQADKLEATQAKGGD